MTTRIGSPDTQADIELRTCLDESPTRSFVMVAGAGSGKTTSLVKALAHLGASKGQALKRNGQKIACITYTEVAVGEIRGDVGESPLFHISTIHSFLWTIVRPFQSDIRAWVEGRIYEKIATAQEKIDNTKSKAKTKADASAAIERYQGQLQAIAAVRKFVYGMGSDYEEGVLGHDDVLRIGPSLIAQHPLLRSLVASRFPYIFVDESQDTVPSVVTAMKEVAASTTAGFSLGFFGDPMQKIYTTGAGAIQLEDGWNQITKPENFRCSTSVLEVINRIRAEDDGLVQTVGIRAGANGPISTPTGSVKLFLFPSNGVNKTSCLDRVRSWMATSSGDELWQTPTTEGDVRALVLVHRIAAQRLGFEHLYAALNDHGAPGFKEGLQEGSLWAVKPFLSFVLPIVEAAIAGNRFQIMSILRNQCPRMSKDKIPQQDLGALLTSLQQDVDALVSMLGKDSTSTVRDVLEFLQQRELLSLEERFLPHLAPAGGDLGNPYTNAMIALLAIPATQMWGYDRYIKDESPFATQQGVKGAQFQRVLAILDDEASDYTLYSYEKYWGFQALSERDEENVAAGVDSVLGRTRRLFYVCCSRAVRDLAVVFFVSDLSAAQTAIAEKGIFNPEDVIVLGAE